MKKVPHDWLVPHDISGDGTVTKCDPTCRAHCRWMDEGVDMLGVEPLADEGWTAIEDQRALDRFPLWTKENVDDLFGVAPDAPEPQPISALFGDIEGVAEAEREAFAITLDGLMADALNTKVSGKPQVISFPNRPGFPPAESPRASVLNEARDLITGDRNAQYGPPTQDFQRTADLLTALGFRFADFNTKDGEPDYRAIIPSDIALIMIELKMSRIVQSRGKRDSWVDGAGYFGCGYECTTEEN